VKILLSADTLGGVWTYATELARALPDVTFVLAAMGGPIPGEVPPNVRPNLRGYKLEWMDDPWDDVARAGDWLLDLERIESPDVVHLNGYAHGALPFAAPKIVVGHSCVLSWWRAVKGEEAPASWDHYAEAVERGLREADLVVAPSPWMLGALHEHYRFETPSRLIYNGREVGRSPSVVGRGTVFAAGRLWDEAKNLRAVVDAAPSIAWPVRIAGDGGTAARNVEHLGKLDRDGMARAFAAAGIYLFPALYEPFGLSILEAALAGCALILGDIPSLREIWRDAAIFVSPRDPAAIAHAVNEVIDDDDLRAELARRARERGAAFTPAAMADGYRAAYNALMAVPA
jgi:glycosyltransferase involved in cell wall biosynthesis